MQKLEQFEHALREQDRKRRTRDALGDETLVYYFNANNKNFRVFVGDVEPFNTPDTEKEKMLRVGDMFYNRQILKECTAVDPNNWRPITTYWLSSRSGVGYFTTQVVSLDPDYGRVVPIGLKIEGPTTLEPSQPTGAIGVYRALVLYSDRSSEEVKPTWTISEAAPVTVRRMSPRIELTATPQPQDREMRLMARYLHPKLKATFTASLPIHIEGSVPIRIERIEIIGPDVIDSNAVNQHYFLRVYYSDGSYRDDEVSAYWNVSSLNVARFSRGDREDVGTNTRVDTMNQPFDTTFVLSAKLFIDCDNMRTTTKTIQVRAGTGMQNNDILPYIGKGPANMRNSTFILGLQGRGTYSRRQNTFSLELCEGEYGYYAYPTRYGKATFINVATGMPGGWEAGIQNPAGDVYEPDIVQVPTSNGQSEPFYIYQTDYAGLGKITFEVK